MTNVPRDKTNKTLWQTLASLPLVDGEIRMRDTKKPSYYIDINGKEWIVILLSPNDTINVVSSHSTQYDSYLYDIAKNEYFPFIKNYKRDIDENFNINHFPCTASHKHHAYQYMSYVIDNTNHVLYWLATDHEFNTRIGIASACNSLISIDIKDLNNLKLIDQISIPHDHFPLFFCGEYSMFIVGNTIQFILDTYVCDPLCGSANTQFEYNIKSKKFKLVHENIHSKCTKHVTSSKVLNLFENLQIHDWIDVRDQTGKFFLAQVLDIMDKKLKSDSGKKTHRHPIVRLESMKILVRYYGWSSDYDEWIDIIAGSNNVNYDNINSSGSINTRAPSTGNVETSLCDCSEQCDFWDIDTAENMYCHRIALPRTQSLYAKSLDGLNGVYSKNHQKMILFGHTQSQILTRQWGGVYYKYQNEYSRKSCQLIVCGVIRQEFETKFKLLMPNDLYNLIYKYYFIPTDKDWQYMIKKDQNGKFMKDLYCDEFNHKSGFVLVNDDNEIFIFGGQRKQTDNYLNTKFKEQSILKLNTSTNHLNRLENIKCPPSRDATWYAVYSRKSKNVHLFTQTFDQHFCICLSELKDAPSKLVDK